MSVDGGSVCSARYEGGVSLPLNGHHSLILNHILGNTPVWDLKQGERLTWLDPKCEAFRGIHYIHAFIRGTMVLVHARHKKFQLWAICNVDAKSYTLPR